MAQLNLSKMNVNELERHISKAQKVLEKKKSANTDAFMKEAKALARKMGVDISSVMAGPAPAKRTRKRRKLEPKYRHPENSQITWSGVGRMPKWAAEAKEAGKLERLRVGS